MKKQIQLFLIALGFFTRIPVSKKLDFSPEKLTKSSRYFSLVGFVVGAVGALVYYISEFVFKDSIAVLLSMISTVLLTGAFHEDGFADVCDGFGGGWTKEKILTIMKDSRVGAYGLIGMILILILKHQSLIVMDMELCFFAILSGHIVSRFAATVLMYVQPYAQSVEKSKAKINQKIDFIDVLVCAIFAILSLLMFENNYIFLILIPIVITVYFLGLYFEKWIGGYTGDCAGAVQQITEVIFYLFLIAFI